MPTAQQMLATKHRCHTPMLVSNQQQTKGKTMTGVTFTTMETVGIRTYTFEVNTPAKLADLTAQLVRNLDAQGGTLVTMDVN